MFSSESRSLAYGLDYQIITSKAFSSASPLHYYSYLLNQKTTSSIHSSKSDKPSTWNHSRTSYSPVCWGLAHLSSSKKSMKYYFSLALLDFYQHSEVWQLSHPSFPPTTQKNCPYSDWKLVSNLSASCSAIVCLMCWAMRWSTLSEYPWLGSRRSAHSWLGWSWWGWSGSCPEECRLAVLASWASGTFRVFEIFSAWMHWFAGGT